MSHLLLDLSGDSLLVIAGDHLLLDNSTPPAPPTAHAKGWFWWDAELQKRDENDVIQTVITVLTNFF